MSGKGVIKTTIKDLYFDRDNAMLTGIIINKSEMKTFESRRNDGETNGVLTLTIRDSRREFVNCVVWGSEYFIRSYDMKFRIGDVVSVISPKISLINPHKTEVYNPITPSQYLLSINEKTNEIVKHEGNDLHIYKSLYNIPFKSVDNVLSLADIKNNGSLSKCEVYVDLLVVVRLLRESREITSERGVAKCRDVIVMDQSLPGMLLSIWNREHIRRSEKWVPLETILFFSDVRAEFSKFHKSVTLRVTGRTIIIENPRTPSATALIKFVKTTPLKDIDNITSMPGQIPELSSITNVMTVKKIYDEAEQSSNSDEEQFTALLYGVCTKFDVDGFIPVTSRRCVRCRGSIRKDIVYCDKESCIELQYNNCENLYSEVFDIGLDFSDYTGTLLNCRLVDEYAEKVLGVNQMDFKWLSGANKTIIKWKYLLERCAVKVLVKKKTVCRANVFILVLDMRPAGLEEVAAKSKIY